MPNDETPPAGDTGGGVRRRVRLPAHLRVPELIAIVTVVLAVGALAIHNRTDTTPNQLLNVSYDPTREVYAALDKSFADQYRKQTGIEVEVKGSHGGSGRQAHDVADGRQRADVVSLGLPSDVDIIAKRGLIAPDWQNRLPDHSAPYTSTVVFLVRKGNPKGIRDWGDLVKPGVTVVSPDPRSSGSGQLNFLAGWGAVTTRGGSELDAKAYAADLFQHIVAFDSGARTSSVSFSALNLGDVQVTWESEALREVKDNKAAGLQVIYPPVSIVAVPSVARVDGNTTDPKIRSIADAYLHYLYSNQAQETFAEYGYRPVNAAILAGHADTLPPLTLFPVTALATDWNDAREKFFGAEGTITAIIAAGPARPTGADAVKGI